MIGPILGGVSRFRDWPNVNVLFDGNSMVAGNGAEYNDVKLPAQLGIKAPLSSDMNRVGNIGVSGQTIQQMTARVAGFVTPYYVAGKKNILPSFELTNSTCNAGRTGAQAIDDYKLYVDAVRAGHADWYMIALTSIPRSNVPYSGYTVAEANHQLEIANALLLANYKDLGFDAVVDLRKPGSPFVLPGYATADFQTPAFVAVMDSDLVHPKGAGYSVIADACISQALLKIPVR